MTALEDLDATGQTVTLTFEGDIDIRSYEEFRDLVIGQDRDGVSCVVLDMGAVTFFDSTGIRGLIAARNQLMADGIEIRLGGLSTIVTKVLDVTALLPTFDRA